MKRVDYLQKIYERNPETGSYIIEVALDKYTDIFNDWDHATILKRDLDPDLSSFLESCSSDIPLRNGIDIIFYISKEAANSEVEEKIKIKLKSYYAFNLRGKERVLNEYFKKALGYIAVSFVFLSLSTLLDSMNLESLLYKTLVEGLSIGGWVFLWEAISFFFFRRSKIHHKAKEYYRLTNAKVFFKYETKYR